MNCAQPVRNRARQRQAFGFLLAIVVFSIAVCGCYRSPSSMRAHAEMDLMAILLRNRRALYGKYPAAIRELLSLPSMPSPHDRVVLSVSDPWGREYHYRAPVSGSPGEIWTLGRDGRVGGDGEDSDLSSRDFGIKLPGP